MSKLPNPSWTSLAVIVVAMVFVGQALILPVGMISVGMEQLPFWFRPVATFLLLLLGLNALLRGSIYPVAVFCVTHLMSCLLLGMAAAPCPPI